MQFDPVEFGKAMGELVRDATAPLLRRIEELESREYGKGADGRDGVDGKDGDSVSIEDVERMVSARMAAWELDFERRAQGVLERAVDRIPKPQNGKDGADGKDGVDGVGFDDVTVEHDGERGFTVKFQRGDRIKAFPFEVPILIDRGFWKDGTQAKQGDGMTCGGSYWIAKQDTTEKPGVSDHWRLAVKKGRDGSNGKDGDPGLPGKKGDPGLNGRDLR